MALDSTEIRLAPTGHVYVGNFGTVLPTDVSTPLAGGFKELGYLDTNGVVLTPTFTSQGIQAWQVPVDVKTTVTAVGLTAKIVMLQVTQESTAEYFFGSSWVNSGGVGKLSVPSSPSLAERSMVVEWTDDEGSINRFVLSRGFLTDRDAMQLQRTAATALGVTFQCLDNNGELAYLLSNDPDLIPST